MNDLEQRVNEVYEINIPNIRKYANTAVDIKEDINKIETLVRHQQAEIQRMKAQPMRSRPISELRQLIEEGKNTQYKYGTRILVKGHEWIEVMILGGNEFGFCYESTISMNHFEEWADLPRKVTE